MRNTNIPKKMQKWLDDNADKIESYHLEDDGFSGDDKNPYSIWVSLKDEWICSWMECGQIHECTQEAFMEYAGSVMLRSEFEKM